MGENQGLKQLLAEHPQFRWFWAGSTMSMLGSRTIGVTYPLLAYELTGSAAWTGWVMFASTVPVLLAQLPAGALTDRLGPHRVMVWSAGFRGVLIALLCVLVFWGVLTIDILIAFALFEGALSTAASIADTALLPSLVKPHRPGPAPALQEGSIQGAALIGRPLGGLLFSIGPSSSFCVNFVMSFSAALMLRRLGPGMPASKPRRRSWRLSEIGVGLAGLWQDRFLRAATLVTALVNFSAQGLITIFLTEATNDQLSGLFTGAILAASGLGGVVGAFLFTRRHRIRRRFKAWPALRRWITRLAGRHGTHRLGRLMMLVHFWSCAFALLLPVSLAGLPWAFALSLFAIGMTGGLSNVVMRQAFSRVPSDRVARVVGTSWLCTSSAAVAGPPLAGLLVECVGPAVALLILAGQTIASAWLVTTVLKWRTRATYHFVHPSMPKYLVGISGG
ncbi:MFS transporter [Nonomuraea sp. NPDC049419]|uniref:MFS transporter n=1 Tax=Nonomuraea sp. NPDC049419 TaxID=3155772 RepID=UPI00343DB558